MGPGGRGALSAWEGDENISGPQLSPPPPNVGRAWHKPLEAVTPFYLLASFDPHSDKTSSISTPFMDEETEAREHA